MAYLVLDLDKTVFVEDNTSDTIHVGQLLSSCSCLAKRGSHFFTTKIINPKELSALIEYAYRDHDGVIILTSGGWDPSLRSELAKKLKLSDEVKQKLENCPFHSMSTDSQLFNLDPVIVHKMEKNNRLNLIVSASPGLKDSYFVMLDDNRRHLDSFAHNPKVQAIWATTNSPFQLFYKFARQALDECRNKELEEKKELQEQQKLFLDALELLNPHAFFSTKASQGNGTATFSDESILKYINT